MSIGTLKLNSEVVIPPRSAGVYNKQRPTSTNYPLPTTTPTERSLSTYVIEYDLDLEGKRIYQSMSKSSRPIIRLSAGATVLAALLVPSSVIDRTIGRAIRQTCLGRSTRKRITRVVRTSSKIQALIRRFPVKTAAVRLLGIGTSTLGFLVAYHDISQWFADAVRDYAARNFFQFNDLFRRDVEYSMLRDILAQGQVAKTSSSDTARMVQIAGEDVRALIVMSSHPIMGEPLDVMTTAALADALLRNLKTAQNDSAQSVIRRMRVTLPISIPVQYQAQIDSLDALEARFRFLLAAARQCINDAASWDIEDILIPITIAVNRLSFLPGFATRIIPLVASGSEVVLTSSFDERNAAILQQLDESNVTKSSSIWESIDDALRVIMGDTDNE